ncbi:tetratricopeptide repeat protein, partial [Legionella anisa]
MYDLATQKALLLIKEGNILDGVLALYEAWMSGSISAGLFFKKNEPIGPIPLTQKVLEARTTSRDSTEDFKLGLCYLSGIGIAQSDEKAQELFSILAEKHHAPAQNLLAWMYENNRAGKELSQDERDDKAVKLYLQAATAGYTPAQYNLALMYDEGRAGKELSQDERDDKAVQLYLQAATAGFAPAQNNLAMMYQNNRAGKELSQDERDDKAVQLYLQAATAGFPSAQNNLAWMYQNNRAGKELTQDKRDIAAVQLYLQAATAGDTSAQNNLACMYEEGRAGKELSQDKRDVEAVQLYLQAATAGYAPAQYNLACMYEEGRAGKELTQDKRDIAAVKLYLQAATAGDPSAQSNLAWMYLDGRAGKELSQNERDDKAVQLYLQAIRAEHASAAWSLAFFYQKNNTDLALKYFSIAAILYRTANVDVQRCITKINSFPASALKDYALARIHQLDSEAIARQCVSFKALKRPSDCLLFINEDLERLGDNTTYLRSVFEKLSSFANESSVLALTEKAALAKLLLKMMTHLSQGDTSNVLTVEAQLEPIQPYCTLLVKHQLELFLHFDNEAKSDLEELATQLLSCVMLLDTRQHREFIHMFAKLLVAIPDDSAFWQENNNNLIRLLIAAFSHGEQPMLIKKQCSPPQFKALLMHIIQAPLDAALDDEPPAIDEAG